MDNMNLQLFMVIFIPLILMLYLLKGRSRVLMSFLIIGLYVCLFAGEINGALMKLLGEDTYYLTISITPVVEEIMKALSILIFAFMFQPDRQLLLESAMACGIGFAVQENIFILVNSASEISLTWAVSRGLGAGLMHGICTLAVGIGLIFIKTRRKLFISGTMALLSVAIVYHATFNLLVQSMHPLFGLAMPICTYVPLMWLIHKNKIEHRIED